MQLIHLLLSLALLWLHLFALRLTLARWLPGTLARALGVLLCVLLFFFIEHFVGLGDLRGLLPCSTLLAAWLVWRQRSAWLAARAEEIRFGLCFAWGMLWKWLFPAIYPTSERVTDLYFVSNYYDGGRLPGPDHWLAGYRFDFYYSFQHYGAALLGRGGGLADSALIKANEMEQRQAGHVGQLGELHLRIGFAAETLLDMAYRPANPTATLDTRG